MVYSTITNGTCVGRKSGAPLDYGQNEHSVIKLNKPFLRRTEFLIVLIEECYTESHILVLDWNKAEVFEKLSHGDGYADQYAFFLIGKTAKQVHICRAKNNVRLKSVLCCLFTDDLRIIGLLIKKDKLFVSQITEANALSLR